MVCLCVFFLKILDPTRTFLTRWRMHHLGITTLLECAPCLFFHGDFCLRPYCVECTRSHPNSEVKRRKARSVLGWGTAWEALRVPLAFYFSAEGTPAVYFLEMTTKASGTRRASQAVPHPSTSRALRCLTSEFGWDRVHSSQYGRWRKSMLHDNYIICKSACNVQKS